MLFKFEKKNIITSVLLAFAYSVIASLGDLVKGQIVSIFLVDVKSLFIRFLVCLFLNILLFVLVPIFSEKYRCKIKNSFLKIKTDKNKLLGNSVRKCFFFSWIFIFLIWIPVFLLTFPGILSYDIVNQLKYAVGTIADNHHPVLHTWMIRVFLLFGNAINGTNELGLGLMSLFQMLFLSYAMARVIALLYKRNVPKWILAATLIFYGMWFLNACMAVSIVKDTLHAAVFLLFGCHYAEIILNVDEYIKHKRNLIIFPVIVFFLCATRNDGIYIYLFCLIIIALLQTKKFIHLIKAETVKIISKYKFLLISMILPIIVFNIYKGPVFDALSIEQGQVREALSMPIQQLQRVHIRKSAELTGDEMAQMNFYFDSFEDKEPGSVCLYEPFNGDYAKNAFISASYENDPVEFWKFYIKMGLKYPKSYLIAFLSNTLGYWYPGFQDFSVVMYDDYAYEMFPIEVQRTGLIEAPILDNIYRSLCNSDFWRNNPILQVLFLPGYTTWFLIYAFCITWGGRKQMNKQIMVLLPLIARFGILILSPIASYRYSWPLILLLPIVFVLAPKTIDLNGTDDGSVVKEKTKRRTLFFVSVLMGIVVLCGAIYGVSVMKRTNLIEKRGTVNIVVLGDSI